MPLLVESINLLCICDKHIQCYWEHFVRWRVAEYPLDAAEYNFYNKGTLQVEVQKFSLFCIIMNYMARGMDVINSSDIVLWTELAGRKPKESLITILNERYPIICKTI